MKKIMLALLVFALSIPAIAFAQSSTQDQQTQQNQAQQESQAQQNQAAARNEVGTDTFPKHTMSGMVSNDGRTLTSDNKSFQISNPNSLKGHDGQTVTVQYVIDPDRNTLKVLSVSPSQPQGSTPHQ
jgi:type II secretory pathway pseudopilin PulG